MDRTLTRSSLFLLPPSSRPRAVGNPPDNVSVLSNLTYALILNPIGAGLAGLAALFGLLGVFSTSRAMTILMTLASLLALIVTGVSFILSMVLFGCVQRPRPTRARACTSKPPTFVRAILAGADQACLSPLPLPLPALASLARSRLNDVGADAMYGNGEWMILGAFVSLVSGPLPSLSSTLRSRMASELRHMCSLQILGTCFSLCGSCGRFRRNNEYKY